MTARKWKDLKDAMPPASRARMEAKKEELSRSMALQELRRALRYTQAELAERLGVEQPEVSRLENQADMFVSTLRRFVEALGGELQIRARFPGADVVIDQFEPLDTRG